MKTVKVNASKSYNVIIGDGLLDSLGEYTREAVGECKLCIVTDDKVERGSTSADNFGLLAIGHFGKECCRY